MRESASRLKYVAPVLRVADLGRSLTYYRDQLGFDLEFHYEGFYASVIRDGCRVHLNCSAPLERDQKAFEAAEHPASVLRMPRLSQMRLRRAASYSR